MKLRTNALSKYQESLTKARNPKNTIPVWRQPNVFAMRQWAKQDNIPKQSSFAHFDDKMKYIEELRSKY